ncbi:phospholipase D-like domain-containing protein [Archaeoglobus veneficus]|uniref:Phospholipase D/transphosphatidylase n=1 Tax=Archaeoglobus veneficus (strain DSM 11195 / SNP6) TaxID=693661 RepID=F2KSE6_ARCVS|nr:phospholipase D-like domain-containing protein [Archaeoglobus veneficus]AEA46915.1 phospholipase D/transphosphatidylase [Archaeoglobus veneficus SNP6]
MLVIFALVLVIAAIVPVSASQIVEVCPNPYGSDDVEYVVLNATSFCTLDDGEGSIQINLTGIVVVAKNATAYEIVFGKKADLEFSGRFALSNEGETIWLRENGKVVDEFTYKKPGEGIVYFKTPSGWDFRYQDWTSFTPAVDFVSGRIIVTPAAYCVEGYEIWLASYTFTDLRSAKGNLTLFLDASPVGGIPIEELEIAKKYRTYFLSSPSYKNFHYKFAVVDGNKVVITTENWKWDKRGYIVEFESEKAAKLLKNVLQHDMIYSSEPGRAGSIKGSYSAGIGKSKEFSGRIEVFVLPDYNPIFEFISKARHRLYIEVPYMDFRWFDDSTPLLDAILKAARNGADVRVILDSEHNREDNEKTTDFLKRIAETEDLKIDARLSPVPLHGKIIISDDDILITSANFNRYGLKLNREVGVIIHDKETGDWLAERFIEDWGGNGRDVKDSEDVLYVLLSIALLAVAVVIAYRAMGKR